MKKCLVLLSIVAVFTATFVASGIVLGKGHVEPGLAQVCHEGFALTVDEDGLEDHLDHGDGRLPACDFAVGNTFVDDDPCPGDLDGDGFADLQFPRDDACGATDACPAGDDDDSDDDDSSDDDSSDDDDDDEIDADDIEACF